MAYESARNTREAYLHSPQEPKRDRKKSRTRKSLTNRKEHGHYLHENRLSSKRFEEDERYYSVNKKSSRRGPAGENDAIIHHYRMNTDQEYINSREVSKGRKGEFQMKYPAMRKDSRYEQNDGPRYSKIDYSNLVSNEGSNAKTRPSKEIQDINIISHGGRGGFRSEVISANVDHRDILSVYSEAMPSNHQQPRKQYADRNTEAIQNHSYLESNCEECNPPPRKQRLEDELDCIEKDLNREYEDKLIALNEEARMRIKEYQYEHQRKLEIQ